MRSPFLGMDPYIELSRLWGDFHSNLIGDIQRAISDILPDRYVVRAGERSYVALTHVDQDHQVNEEYREAYLEIRQVDPEHKLVTSIEVLSPSNKRPGSKGWRLYHRKRTAYVRGYANFAELDLLRLGWRMPMVSQRLDSPYYLLVCRKKEAPRRAVWPSYLTDRLPAIPIPLVPPDSDISLDPQPLAEAIYSRSRYERDIDYRRPLDPPFSPAQQAWFAARLERAD